MKFWGESNEWNSLNWQTGEGVKNAYFYRTKYHLHNKSYILNS